jgi:hypothetical protein
MTFPADQMKDMKNKKNFNNRRYQANCRLFIGISQKNKYNKKINLQFFRS